MSGQRHPDTETLASLRAGLVSGFRGRRLKAHVARCARCAATGDELAAVSSFLASVPDPVLPQTFEQRITAAIAAEAATRTIAATESAHAATETGTAALSPAGADSGSSRQRTADKVPGGRRPSATPPRRRPTLRFRPAIAFVPVVACLLAGFGYVLSNIGGSANSSSSSEFAASSSASATGEVPLAGPAVSKPDAGHQAQSAAGQASGFLVATSGTRYRPGTLGAQVRAETNAKIYGSSLQPSPSNSASSTSGGGVVSAAASSTQIPTGFTYPSAALVGCVLHLTNNHRPTLVDQATYQGRPAYVIAVSDHVWVVGRGCTKSHPELITTVALTGAS
jgi:hypothetical protein